MHVWVCTVLRWVQLCQQEFCHVWRKVFFWLGLWLWRHGYNNEITDFHHSVEQIRHCIFLRCLPCVIFMESSGKFSIGLSSLFTGNIDWQGCLLPQQFICHAPNCSLSSDTGGNCPSFFAISGPLLSQMLHLHVFWLVRAETTLPSTIVSKPLN